MAKKKSVKKQDPHAFTVIPEGMTIEQLESQITAEIPFQFVYDLREAFRSWDFYVGNIVIKDKFEIWFDIEYSKYRKQTIVRRKDCIKIIGHQSAYVDAYGHVHQYYHPLLKGEVNINTNNITSIFHEKISTLTGNIDAIVEYFANCINDRNRTDFWCSHHEEIRKQGIYKQEWRISKLTDEWMKEQEYDTMPNPYGYKSYLGFDTILSNSKKRK